MATYLLVHGMWHGGWCWRETAALLRKAGHEVFAPALTGVGERSHVRLPVIDHAVHVQDVTNLIAFADLRDVQLVGHSYAGGLVMEVADRMPERIGHLFCLDALVPASGKSYREQFPNFYAMLQQQAAAEGDGAWVGPPQGWDFGVHDPDRLAWLKSKLTPHPLATLESPVRYDNPAVLALPRTFISCTEGKTPEAVAAEEKKWTEKGWRYRFLATGHDAMITDPHGLAAILLDDTSRS